MLSNFFKLDNAASAHPIPDANAFGAMFANTNELINVNARAISFPPFTTLFQGRRFNNVDFRRSTFEKITCNDCEFEDCIFLGCEFREVEFHGCRFINCNFWKADFENVYIDIRLVKFDRKLRRNHANVMLGFYQTVFANYENAHQWKFSLYADVLRRRWDRHYIAYKIRQWKPASGREFLGSVADLLWLIGSLISNWFYGITSRYGYGPLRFLTISVVLLAAISHLVLKNWSRFGFSNEIGQGSFPEAVFYVATVISTLGYSRYVPSTDFGLYFTSFLGLLGVAWTGLFIALLLRRFVR